MQAESCGFRPLEEARWAAVGGLKRETSCCVLWAQPGSFVHFGRSHTESKQRVLGAGNRAQCQCTPAQKPNPAAALGPSPRPGQTACVSMYTVHSWGSWGIHISALTAIELPRLFGQAPAVIPCRQLMTRTTQPVSVHTTCEHSTKMKTDRRDTGGRDQEQGPGLAAQLPPARLRLAGVRQPLSALPEETVTWPLGGGDSRYVGVTAVRWPLLPQLFPSSPEERSLTPKAAVPRGLRAASPVTLSTGGSAVRSVGLSRQAKFNHTLTESSGLEESSKST